jgi:hypothetical protein
MKLYPANNGRIFIEFLTLTKVGAKAGASKYHEVIEFLKAFDDE